MDAIWHVRPLRHHNSYSPPEVDRIWGIWGSYHDIPKAIFYLPKGDYNPNIYPIIMYIVVSIFFSIIPIKPLENPIFDHKFIVASTSLLSPIPTSVILSGMPISSFLGCGIGCIASVGLVWPKP